MSRPVELAENESEWIRGCRVVVSSRGDHSLVFAHIWQDGLDV